MTDRSGLVALLERWTTRVMRARREYDEQRDYERRVYLLGKIASMERAIDELEAVLASLVTPSGEGRPLEGAESVRVQHARRQGAADGFQQGWHAALSRIREGDKLHDLIPIIPNPAVMLVEQLSNALHAVEWVRQASGNRYACPSCHGITERDGGGGHVDDCQAERLRREAEDFIYEHSTERGPRASEPSIPPQPPKAEGKEATRQHEYRYENPDDELLPLTRCACGCTFSAWQMNISVYKDDPTEMPCCGRRLWFSNGITIHEADLQREAEGKDDPS